MIFIRSTIPVIKINSYFLWCPSKTAGSICYQIHYILNRFYFFLTIAFNSNRTTNLHVLIPTLKFIALQCEQYTDWQKKMHFGQIASMVKPWNYCYPAFLTTWVERILEWPCWVDIGIYKGWETHRKKRSKAALEQSGLDHNLIRIREQSQGKFRAESLLHRNPFRKYNTMHITK